MSYPKLEVNLAKVVSNMQTVVDLAADSGIEIMGVTKGVCADLKVAQAMLQGGVKGLADSRVTNLSYLAENLDIAHPLMLLRVPMLSEVKAVVEYADLSLNSELKVIKALNQAAVQADKLHRIILMVDLGDRREGILPEDVVSVAEKVSNLARIKLLGLGANLVCYRGVLPSAENMQLLVDLQQKIEQKLGRKLTTLSGGNSGSLPYLQETGLPDSVNQLRIGETVLLGSNVVTNQPFATTYQDAFLLTAEIIELKFKPAQAEGKQSQNAFGEPNLAINSGVRNRAILAVGRQDIDVAGLTPVEQGVEIENASSDHLVVDVTACQRKLQLGSSLRFKLNYAALLRAMTSNYVQTVYREEENYGAAKAGLGRDKSG